MDLKFYVSYDAAMLLKEKGYDRECIAYYQNGEFHPYSVNLFKLSISDKNAAPSYMNQYSAPTKVEAIDWLESKGMVVEAFYTRHHWFFSIIDFNVKQKTFADEYYPTRLEAKEAAIIKALELL